MNRKTGFSLVEMAIVLMVIGIIVGISIKTLSIIDTAKSKKDLTTITRLEAGLKSYLAVTGALPIDNITEPWILDTALLESTHYISADDLLSVTHKDHKWAYHRCNINGEFTIDNTTEQPYTPSGNMICLTLRDATRNVDMYASFACTIENQFDDRHFLRGKGRSISSSEGGELTEEQYRNCLDVSGTVQYMYRVL